MFKGIEIKKLVLVSTLCCVLLIASVSVYLIFSSRSNLRSQTDRMKTAMAEQIAGHLQYCYASMADYLRGIDIQFGSSMQELLSNSAALYDFFMTSILRAYNADFIVVYSGEKVTASAASPGLQVPQNLDLGMTGGEEYAVVDEIGGRQGTFLVINKPGLIPGSSMLYVIDNTSQDAAIRQAYEDEKSDAIRQQVWGVIILFLLILALSLLIIYISIRRWLGRPMERLSREAREIMRGEAGAEEEVREGSIFANLQRLVNSGRVILGKGEAAGGGGETEKPIRRREISKVIAVWAAVTTLLFLASTIILLVTSISLTNSKTEEILNSVDQEMADYYAGCYDSIIDYTKTNPDVYIGAELWNPDATIDRDATIERLANLVRVTFDCDANVAYVEPGGKGKYYTSVKEGVELKEPLLTEVGDSINIYEGYYREGDLVILNMNPSDYPGFGEGQFEYYVVNVTPQADVLEGLYEDGTSSLLTSQLLLSLLFLLLCLAFSPLVMAWATMRYVTRPIIELDTISEKLMEGDLNVEITVDERSAFADMQRLLKRAQEMLQSMA